VPLKHFNQGVAINELDWPRTIAPCFLLGFERERSGGNDQALVSTALHCTEKIPYLRWGDRTLVSFALKKYVEADERINLQGANPVYSAVAALARN